MAENNTEKQRVQELTDKLEQGLQDLFNSDSTLKSNEDLTKMFEDAGLSKEDHIITYCTGGIRSAYMQLVMEMCGFENSENYDESFYRWCVEGNLEK